MEFLHVSFSDSLGLASVRPPHRVCRVRQDSKEPKIDYRDAETDIGQTKQAHITPVLTYIYIGVTCCL